MQYKIECQSFKHFADWQKNKNKINQLKAETFWKSSSAVTQENAL